ncbi:MULTISPECIES: phytanoyl-CoA dioxygenase family protein [Niastella]|uniref:Phytanoyl-CoA dioxygenase n=1 Tax=Niastella soli TaxID=2821487 RepID=A0ABS3YN56_9BACT|nr:hypothetical protein [Niastella soli]MBO9199310.1 hypothetical protein [Niastella soli]
MESLRSAGYAIINDVFTINEVTAILDTINSIDTNGPAFRKTNDLFAIRRFVKEVPVIIPYIFTSRLRDIISQLFGKDYFLVKSIYFDKPEQSNWFVAYHQDLTISVDQKKAVEGLISGLSRTISLPYNHPLICWRTFLRSGYTSMIPMKTTAP